MTALSLPLADGVTIQIGNNIWNISTDFIIYLIIAALVGLVAETIVGWRLPFGIIGAIIAALVGGWLLTKVIIINGFEDINLYGVPLFKDLLGAIILVGLWHLLTFGFWRGRSRRRAYYREA